MPLDFDILGQGIYSPNQAARLVGSSVAEVLRWTRGSESRAPLWSAYYSRIENSTALNFLDLIELRVVKRLRSAGLSLQSIRYARDLATDKFGIDRPLASEKFQTDGLEVFMEASEKSEELWSLSKKRPGQKVFSSVIEQSLKDLEFDEGLASRWRPSKTPAVVIDPARQFGAPVLDEYSISTFVLMSEMQIFNDARYLSKLYEVPLRLVKQALSYEKSLDRQVGKGPF